MIHSCIIIIITHLVNLILTSKIFGLCARDAGSRLRLKALFQLQFVAFAFLHTITRDERMLMLKQEWKERKKAKRNFLF